MIFHVRPHTLNEALPIIYMWEIHDLNGLLVGRYVGKAKAGAKRPRKHYKRNVANILLNKSYRKSNPVGFRRIHQALADAERNGHQITLQFLCNIESHENINDVEHKYIRAYDCIGAHLGNSTRDRAAKHLSIGYSRWH